MEELEEVPSEESGPVDVGEGDLSYIQRKMNRLRAWTMEQICAALGDDYAYKTESIMLFLQNDYRMAGGKIGQEQGKFPFQRMAAMRCDFWFVIIRDKKVALWKDMVLERCRRARKELGR